MLYRRHFGEWEERLNLFFQTGVEKTLIKVRSSVAGNAGNAWLQYPVILVVIFSVTYFFCVCENKVCILV